MKSLDLNTSSRFRNYAFKTLKQFIVQTFFCSKRDGFKFEIGFNV